VLKNYELEVSEVVSPFGHSSWQKEGRKNNKEKTTKSEHHYTNVVSTS